MRESIRLSIMKRVGLDMNTDIEGRNMESLDLVQYLG